MYNIITLKMVEDIILCIVYILLLMYNCCIEYLDLISDIIENNKYSTR